MVNAPAEVLSLLALLPLPWPLALLLALAAVASAWPMGRLARERVEAAAGGRTPPPRRALLLGGAAAGLGLVGMLGMMPGVTALLWSGAISAGWMDPEAPDGPAAAVGMVAGTVSGELWALLYATAGGVAALRLGAALRWWAAAVFAAAGAVVLSVGWELLLQAVRGPVEAQAAAELVTAPQPAPVALFNLAFVMVLGPVVEELIFRGALYELVRRGLGVRVAVVVSGVAFGLFHMDSPWVVVPLTVFGLWLAGLRAASGSVGPAIFAHVLNNVFAVVLMTLARG